MTIGPLIGGVISETSGIPITIDGTPGFIPPPLVFVVAAFLMLLVLIPIIKAKEFER